jgi:hypothetical protein
MSPEGTPDYVSLNYFNKEWQTSDAALVLKLLYKNSYPSWIPEGKPLNSNARSHARSGTGLI